MKCEHCGFENNDNSKFCQECGKLLDVLKKADILPSQDSLETDKTISDDLPELITEAHEDHNMSITKLVIICTIISLLIGIAIFGYNHYETGKKADDAYKEAIDLYNAKDHVHAIKKLNLALKYRSKPEYHFEKFKNLLYSGGTNIASESIDNALELDPNNNNYIANAAYFYFITAQDPPKSIKYFEKLAQQNPKNLQIKFDLAFAYCNNSDYNSAEKLLLDIVKKDPYFYPAWDLLGKIYYTEGNIKKSLELREKAVEVLPDNHYYQMMLGTTYDINGITDKAISAYEKAIELDKNRSKNIINRIAQLKGEKPQDSIEIPTTTVPYENKNGHTIIKAKVNGKTGKFRVIPNIAESIISESFAQKAKIIPAKDSFYSVFHNHNGVLFIPVTYDNVQLGDFKLSNIRIGIISDTITDGYDGMFGANVLKAFQVKPEPLKEELILTPQ